MTVMEFIKFAPTLPINPNIIYILGPIQGYIYELLSIGPAIIFIFMALVFASLVDCFDVVLSELPSPNIPASFIMVCVCRGS